MIAVDTNLLVRILVKDDRAQLKRAREVLEQAAERSEAVLVPDIVLAEVDWVLGDTYGVPRPRVLQALQALAGNDLFEFESRERVNEALARYQNGKAELSDYLIGEQAASLGARTTFTFDRALRDAADFTLA